MKIYIVSVVQEGDMVEADLYSHQDAYSTLHAARVRAEELLDYIGSEGGEWFQDGCLHYFGREDWSGITIVVAELEVSQ